MVHDTYPELYQQYRWSVPAKFNIAEQCCTRWANKRNRIAIRYEDESGKTRNVTFAKLEAESNRLANALRAQGITRGDRVAVVLPQCPETAITHMACYKLGAIAMPLSGLFGPEALSFRFGNSGAKAAIVDAAYLENCREARSASLQKLFVVASSLNPVTLDDGELDWATMLARSRDAFRPVKTLADDPAVLIYTSGTTGPPKGALIPHRALMGNLTGFVASQNWFPLPGDVFWSPADWAWTGGLMDALLPTLYFGKPIVAHRGRFSAELAYEIIEKYRVTNTFLFPTALKLMMTANADPKSQYQLPLRAIMSAGESVGETLFEWCQTALGVTVNEMFGQTEINYIVGNSANNWPARAGSIGRPYPGHQVAVIDDDGNPVTSGELGEVALNRCDIHGDPDPVFFLGYWNNPDATAEKFTGDWCRTGDLASVDADGYLWYAGRADDMFKAAGYRIGPGEIENCLLKHPAVANAAVVPKPDANRGNLVKAFVVLTQGHTASAALIKELQNTVRGKLAPYEYPKEIEFIAELPMTTTGKVQRRVLREQEAARANLARH